jgi:integrase
VAYSGTLDHLERIVNPDRLCKVTAATVSRFLMKLRSSGLSDATVAKTARQLKAALRWAERQGMVAKAPNIEMPKRQKGAKLMKGRAISGEEFDRMLAAVPKVRPKDAPAWERLLQGLWLSGLRLAEAVGLSWDDDTPFYADLSGKHPRFRILGEAQKSGRDEVLPMTPDFATFLQATPKGERVGVVFALTNRTTDKPFTLTEVCRVVSTIGEKARVVVDKATGKHASAHDLRRAFGTRWAKRVMPAVLI